MNLNGCCFVEGNAPIQPQHPECHCYYQSIPTIEATAICPVSKFTGYIFKPDHPQNQHKYEMFTDWGYTIEDSENLAQEFERQAKQKYELGEYELGKLDDQGQRITIRIEIKNKLTGADISFDSGWMVYHDGRLLNTTPYGGK